MNVSYSFVRLRELHVTDLLPSLDLLLHVLGEENHFGHYGQLRQWLSAEVAVLQGLGPDETGHIYLHSKPKVKGTNVVK